MTADQLKQRLRSEGKLLLAIKAVPKASRDEVAGWLDDGSLKVKVTAAPEKGKANAAICRVVAEWLAVPASRVRVVRGETSARKQVEVTQGLTDD